MTLTLTERKILKHNKGDSAVNCSICVAFFFVSQVLSLDVLPTIVWSVVGTHALCYSFNLHYNILNLDAVSQCNPH